MARIMNEESDWDYNWEGDTVEGPVDVVSRDKVVHMTLCEKPLGFSMYHWSLLLLVRSVNASDD